jgi:hypothetical protein
VHPADGLTVALTIGLPDLPDFDGDDLKPQAPVSAGIDLAVSFRPSG